jgi:chromate transporter
VPLLVVTLRCQWLRRETGDTKSCWAACNDALMRDGTDGLPRSRDLVPLGSATRAWWRVALQSFGGPAGQIAVMHREMVDERRWIGERRFLHALSYCTLLPGPEAQQLAIYIGWLLNGTLGGLIAGVLFVLPGFVAIMALSILYAGWGDSLAVTALFAGIAPAVLAIVSQAVVRVSKRALLNPVLVAIAVSAFAALALFGIPFPIVIAGAGLLGFGAGHLRPDLFRGVAHATEAGHAPAPVISDDALHSERPSALRAGRILVVGVVLWFAPVVAFGVAVGGDSVFVDQGIFFSGAALVTFGGAYAVLAFVAQRAVEVYGWLAPGEMITGLAMAESTPGPLIQVVQFVGFMGAYSDPGSLDPWVAGMLAACLVTWVTFVPCFLFIFLGAPHVEALRHNERLSSALAGITAAVVGVIANLAVYFALHTLFVDVERQHWGPIRLLLPDVTTFVPEAAAVAAFAFVVLFRLRWSVLRTLGACAAVGATLHLLIR